MTLGIWERSAATASAATEDGVGAGADAGGPSGPARRAVRRRRLFWVAVGLVVLALVATAVTVGVRRAAHRGVALDPENPGREGAQAIARVLDDRGVGVSVARSQRDLLDEPEPGAGTTVVVTSTSWMSEQTARTMLDHVRGADRLVLVEPSRQLLEALDLPVYPAGDASPAGGVRAGCVLDGLAASDIISPAGRTYRSSDDAASSCFEFAGAAQLVALPRTAELPEVVVLGDGSILSNSEITRLDDAGVAVRLLARGDRLLWYVPSPLDITSEDDPLTAEVPRAVGPLVALTLLAVLVLMVWRGRRFGPLVQEPLPAVVKAIETTQSRGRLYRKARDTERAAQALRARECRRIGTYLGLPAAAGPYAVAAAAAEACGRDPAAVLALLAGSPVQSEDALLTLAHDLTDLEKEVRRA